MKKHLLVLTVLCITVITAYAQNDQTAKFSLGVNAGGVVGPASSTFTEASNVSLKLEYPVAGTPLYLTITAGYTGFITNGGYYYYSGTDGSYSNGSIASFIPLQAGARVYATNRIFIEGDLGVSFNINSNSIDYTGKKAALIYTPIVGYTIPIGSTSLDVSIRYDSRIETGYNYSQIAAGAAFNFNL